MIKLGLGLLERKIRFGLGYEGSEIILVENHIDIGCELRDLKELVGRLLSTVTEVKAKAERGDSLHNYWNADSGPEEYE